MHSYISSPDAGDDKHQVLYPKKANTVSVGMLAGTTCSPNGRETGRKNSNLDRGLKQIRAVPIQLTYW